MEHDGITADGGLLDLHHAEYHERTHTEVCDLWAVQEALPMV